MMMMMTMIILMVVSMMSQACMPCFKYVKYSYAETILSVCTVETLWDINSLNVLTYE